MEIKYLQFLVLIVFVTISCTYQEINAVLDLKSYQQPIIVGKDVTYDSTKEDPFYCSRDCVAFPDSRICYYEFVVEQYHAMGPACMNCPFNKNDCFNLQCVTADGIEKTVLTVNRMMPATAIHVCIRDRIIIDVINQMPGRSVTFHWHGLKQTKSPWMDGSSFVSQCPILPGQKFRYDFVAENIGTHLYYSQSSFQMLDGLAGPFIVRDNAKDIQANYYDFDLFSHTVFIQDWMHLMADNKYPGYNRNEKFITLKADSYLINGRGIQKVESNYFGARPKMPYAEFIVNRKYKYRFRFIASLGLMCTIKVAIQSHSMRLIAVDGNPVQPVDVDVLYMNGGERFDVVIEANKRSSSYWIYVKGMDTCNNASQIAVLRYEESYRKTPKWRNFDTFFDGKKLPSLNNITAGCVARNNICMEHLSSLFKVPEEILKPDPDKRFRFNSQTIQYFPSMYESYEYHKYYLQKVTSRSGKAIIANSFNNKVNVMPSYSLLSESQSIPENLKCPETCVKYCECLHLVAVPLNSVIEIEFTDEFIEEHESGSKEKILMDSDFGNIQAHHFHGHGLFIIKQGTQTELEMFGAGNNPIRSNVLVQKDVVTVSERGYTVVRFIATNPGFWPLRSFFPYKSYNGMTVIFQVGEQKNFLVHPSDFPKCGNYLPSINED